MAASDSSDAPSRAITTIGSVLTGGVVGCTRLADELGHRNVISTDMGGTTFLVGLIVDGEPVSTTSTVLNQYQLNVPMVDVHTIGAGGGAIAWVDDGGNLHVGPRSAGARPGPACYGDGRHRAHRDRRRPVCWASSTRTTSSGAARSCPRSSPPTPIRTHIAEPLGLSVDDACAAIYAIQNAQTADLVRKVVVNSGQDPRDFVLYAFGGAGPMHCVSYCRGPGASARSSCRSARQPRCSPPTAWRRQTSCSPPSSRSPTNFPPEPAEFNGAFGQLRSELEDRLAEQRLRLRRGRVSQRGRPAVHDADGRGRHPGADR